MVSASDVQCDSDGVQCDSFGDHTDVSLMQKMFENGAISVVDASGPMATQLASDSVIRSKYFAAAVSTQSAGMRRLLSNASALVEVAASSGIKLTPATAEALLSKRREVFEESAQQLQTAFGDDYLSDPRPFMQTVSGASVTEVAELMAQAKTKESYLSKFGNDVPIGMAIATTTSVFVGLAAGESPTSDTFLNSVNSWLPALAGLTGNPGLAVGTTVLTGLFTGLLQKMGKQNTKSPMEQAMSIMYTQIMREVRDLIKQNDIMNAVTDFSAEFAAIAGELEWVPAMLGGNASSSTTDPTSLIYMLMIQHDVAKLTHKIRYHEHLSSDIFQVGITIPMLLMCNLQVDVLADIMIKDNKYAAAVNDRVEVLLDEYEAFFDISMKGFTKRTTPWFVGGEWGRIVWTPGTIRPRDKTGECSITGGYCTDEANGVDVCNIMKCSGRWRSWWCNPICTERECTTAVHASLCDDNGYKFCDENLKRQYIERINQRTDKLQNMINLLLGLKAGEKAPKVTQATFDTIVSAPDVAKPACEGFVEPLHHAGCPAIDLSNLKKYDGYSKDYASTYSQGFGNCNEADFCATYVCDGMGYFFAPHHGGGWCRFITADNVEKVRTAHSEGGGAWVSQASTYTYLPP